VRGLDYYTRTVFEFRCDVLGAQSGIGGGGRYDRLMEQLGGDPTPGVGWATGLERVQQAIANRALERASGAGSGAAETDGQDIYQDTYRPAFMFAVTEPAAREQAFKVASELRASGIGATIDAGGRSLKGQMRQAGRMGAPWVVIIGPDDWSRGVATVRDMRQAKQEEVALDRLGEELSARSRRTT
jgi:histidyl-tRNA synthetase